MTALPWNIRQALDHLTSHSWRYLLDVAHFIQTHTIKPDKLLAFHCFEGACIRKGKVGKENEFGRVFQLGRIGGNFRIPFTCTDVRMNDKQSLLPAMAEHAAIFGADVLEAVGTDKGYYSATNIREVQQAGINADGIQRPCKVKDPPPEEVVERLRSRRAGIEPLIGHAKAFGLGHAGLRLSGGDGFQSPPTDALPRGEGGAGPDARPAAPNSHENGVGKHPQTKITIDFLFRNSD